MKIFNFFNPVFLSFFATTAFAGDMDLSSYAKETEAKVQSSTALIKKSCKCDIDIEVDFNSFKSLDDALVISPIVVDPILKNGAAYCDDAKSREAICKIKKLKYEYASESKMIFSNGLVRITTDGKTSNTWENLIYQMGRSGGPKSY